MSAVVLSLPSVSARRERSARQLELDFRGFQRRHAPRALFELFAGVREVVSPATWRAFVRHLQFHGYVLRGDRGAPTRRRTSPLRSAA